MNFNNKSYFFSETSVFTDEILNSIQPIRIDDSLIEPNLQSPPPTPNDVTQMLIDSLQATPSSLIVDNSFSQSNISIGTRGSSLRRSFKDPKTLPKPKFDPTSLLTDQKDEENDDLEFIDSKSSLNNIISQLNLNQTIGSMSPPTRDLNKSDFIEKQIYENTPKGGTLRRVEEQNTVAYLAQSIVGVSSISPRSDSSANNTRQSFEENYQDDEDDSYSESNPYGVSQLVKGGSGKTSST